MDLIFLKELVEYGVIGVLVCMSFVSFWFGIERYLFYKDVNLREYKNKNRLELDLYKRVTTIATIGSNAPYIGLLGTVVAIMITFLSIDESGVQNSGSIMNGLALALKATAAGLLVAIPSIVIYNYLAQKAENILIEWEIYYDTSEELES